MAAGHLGEEVVVSRHREGEEVEVEVEVEVQLSPAKYIRSSSIPRPAPRLEII